MDENEFLKRLAFFMAGATIGFILSQPLAFVAKESGQNSVQNEAVERGYGEIVVKDGVRRFQWKLEVTSGSEEQ